MRHRHRTDQVRPAVGLAPPHRPIADDPDAAQEGRGRPGRHPGRTGTDGIAERPGLFPARASLSFALAYRRNEADPSVFSQSLSPSPSRLLDGTPRSTSSEPLESPESTFSATEGKDRQTDDVGLAHGGPVRASAKAEKQFSITVRKAHVSKALGTKSKAIFPLNL